jgi:hypothetical protein
MALAGDGPFRQGARQVLSGMVTSEERMMAAEHHDGRSVAAWTAVVILLVASFLICLAIVLASRPMAYVGIGLLVLGMVAGKALAMAGFGQPRLDRPPTRTDRG